MQSGKRGFVVSARRGLNPVGYKLKKSLRDSRKCVDARVVFPPYYLKDHL
ncbi:MAG: hypothetical protein KF716_25975 [Anaerolineae bacterium]|nr:hypothetical protein [Anaerolineae bacterium]